MAEPESHIYYWRCPNCGQTHFGDIPPDLCAFCEDYTTWQPFHTDHLSQENESIAPEPSTDSDNQAANGWTQPPLFDPD